ncbi:MAG: 23S rRNA (pseudouridine(1915)-N(3))-methyltransferase RlmH [Verrucomicrobia bacterium]|nr:23S rRNA (pseudouridine(1915)-N(3))-methyltransferase RlmH [Verrucomicrobiota bacterium]NDE63435.1 23S rRNA (pseudouridine(1915)-N(3))-methyltransferase RlmH [Chlamydiota bacterium]
MIEIRIYSVGKNKDEWLSTALTEYEKRLKTDAKIHWILCKNDSELEKLVSLELEWIALDPEGKMYSSEDFSQLLHKHIETWGKKLVFVIGSSEGLTPFLKTKAKLLLSLSKLTFTHQITRLILLEQVYRAVQIGKNTPYHK